MSYAWHRSPSKLTLTNQLESNGTCSRHVDAAAIGWRTHRFDVQARVARPLNKPQTAVDGPIDARKPHRDLGILEPHRHEADQRSQTGRADAENSVRSKLWVAGHDSQPLRASARRARRQKAHRMGERRPTRARALATVCRHGRGNSRAAAALRRARFSS